MKTKRFLSYWKQKCKPCFLSLHLHFSFFLTFSWKYMENIIQYNCFVMLGIGGKLNFTGFLMLLTYASSFFIINSDLPVSTLLFCLSWEVFVMKKKISQGKHMQFRRKLYWKISIIWCIILIQSFLMNDLPFRKMKAHIKHLQSEKSSFGRVKK